MEGSMFIGTWWSLVPPLLAIVLALATKEVYSSLFYRSGSRRAAVHRVSPVGRRL